MMSREMAGIDITSLNKLILPAGQKKIQPINVSGKN